MDTSNVIKWVVLAVLLLCLLLQRWAYRKVIRRNADKISFMEQAMGERLLQLRNHRQLIDIYKRTKIADNAMIERLLREVELQKEQGLENFTQLVRLQSLGDAVSSNLGLCKRYGAESNTRHGVSAYIVPSRYFELAIDASKQIADLNTKPDDGFKSTTPTTGDGAGTGGPAPEGV